MVHAYITSKSINRVSIHAGADMMADAHSTPPPDYAGVEIVFNANKAWLENVDGYVE